MKKLISIFVITLGFINAFSQSVYMHEAQQDAQNAESLTFMTILYAALFIGAIYMIYKIIAYISESIEKNKAIKRREGKEHLSYLVSSESYTCPICGKTESKDKAVVMLICLDAGCYHIRFCRQCSEAYSHY